MAGLEDIIYHIIRCSLLHQCKIENRIEFSQQTMLGDFKNKFRIPASIVYGLLMSVILSKENATEKMPNAHVIQVSSKEISLNAFWGQGEISV